MKTASEQSSDIQLKLGWWLRGDPILASGKSLITELVEAIQLDAYEKGIRDAAEVAYKYGTPGRAASSEIVSLLTKPKESQ